MRQRVLAVSALLFALFVWSFVAFGYIVFLYNTGPCALLQTVPFGPDNTPWPSSLTPEQWAEITREQCGGGVPYAELFVFGAGYVVIGAVAVRLLRDYLASRRR
jgi:hypothetical protein